MFLCLVVTVPLLALNKFPYVTAPWYVGLLSLCTVSSFALYYSAIRGQGFSLRKKLPYIGLLALIGEENTFLATDAIGEAGNAALRAATAWLAKSSAEGDPGEVHNANVASNLSAGDL
jgi:hypothetical protein